ncbi:MAG: amino acid ABC transporter permease [Epulopiscium sp. Nele67-Bin004]|nr:MAG: amino acid ABC transporter permease [Epulopiscium sp. Nele67-Bin004]
MFTIERTTAFFEVFMARRYYEVLWSGLQNTLLLTVIATTIGIAIGLIVAMVQIAEVKKSDKFAYTILKIAKILAKLYVDIIRGTPVVVQISFLWLVVLGPIQIIPRVMVGGIAFGINSGAYMAEVIRGGIQAIDKGQMEAGRSLGMSHSQTMKEIILPQAIKQMLPALVNEFIVLIKETAIIGFIGGMDLMKSADIMIGATYNYEIPLLMVAIIYLIITSILTMFMRNIEKRLNKSR